jgi:hypothetical protein
MTTKATSGSPADRPSDDVPHAYAHLPNCDTKNATTIDFEKIPVDRNWVAPSQHPDPSVRGTFRYYNQLNKGRQHGPKWQNKWYQTYEQNWYIMDTLADRMEMTPRLRGIAINQFVNLDHEALGRPKDEVALGTALLVLQEDGRREVHPNCKERDELFCEMCESYGVSMDRVDRMYYKLAAGKGQTDRDLVHIHGRPELKLSEYIDHDEEMKNAHF